MAVAVRPLRDSPVRYECGFGGRAPPCPRRLVLWARPLSPCEDPAGPSLRAMKHFLRMWLRCRALHGRRLLATTREAGHLCASAPRDPGAGCTHAAGCPEPHLCSAHLPPADRLASNGSSRLVRSPGTHLASTEPSRSFAHAHLLSTITPHVHQPHGRFSNGNELCV